MAEQGLLSKEMTLSAYIRYKVAKSSEKKFDMICRLEQTLLQVLEELDPDSGLDTPLHLDFTADKSAADGPGV